MKVSVELSPEHRIPYAVIYTDHMTEEIQQVLEGLQVNDMPIIAWQKDRMVILQPTEIYMVRIENGETILYGKTEQYCSRKRLYELSAQLGKQFMQISKSALVNLSYLDSVESGFSGTLLLKLRNGCKEYVSRKYLPEFKTYLGL